MIRMEYTDLDELWARKREREEDHRGGGRC